MSVFKFLLIALLVLFLARVLRFALTIWLAIRKAGKLTREQQTREGQITIVDTPQKPKMVDKTEGEYVTYEEH
jgi:hypothetical protein